MRRWASAAPIGSRRVRRSEGFSGLHEIALADRPLGSQAQQPASMRLLRLQTAWARAVGTPLREVAQLRACAGQRLLVDVPDAAWKREMDRLKPHLLERLAREVPCAPITELDFQVARGPRPVPARRSANRGARTLEPPQPAAGEPLPDGLFRALEQVGDVSLRGRLGQVMGRYLARTTSAL